MSVKRKVDSLKEYQKEQRRVAELERLNQEQAQQITDMQVALCEVFEQMVAVMGGDPNG